MHALTKMRDISYNSTTAIRIVEDMGKSVLSASCRVNIVICCELHKRGEENNQTEE